MTATAAMLVALACVASGGPDGDAGDGAGRPRPEPSVEERVEVVAAMPDAADVAAFVTTVDGDDLAERGEDLAGALRRVPGARVREYGGLGRYATVSLRASTAEQVTVLVDGVPQNRALGGPVDLSFIPATQIESVTVYRGFGPASLGPGGLGGVVDVRTRAPEGGFDGRVDVLSGGLGTTRLSTGWSMRAGRRSSVRIGAETISSDGDFRYRDAGDPFVPDDTVLRTRENNDVDYGSLLVQGVTRDLAGGELRVGARVQRRERGVPGVDGLPALDTRLDERLHDAHASWSRRGSDGSSRVDVLLDVFGQRIAFDDPEGELGVGVQDQVTDLRGGGLAGGYRTALGGHHVGVRLDMRREQARVTDRALAVQDRGGAARTRIALTAEDVVPLGRLTLAPSLAWELVVDDFRPGGEGTIPPSSPEQSQARASGKLGAAWAAGPRTTVRGSVGRFHRHPSLLELFGDRGSVVGNPALEPESGWSAEAGALWRNERTAAPWTVELVAFARDVEDLIVLRPNSQATSIPRNLRDARVLGLEGSLGVRLPAGFALEASGTLQRTEDRSGGPDDGRPIAYQPDDLGFLGLRWSHRALRVRWEVTRVGDNRVGPGETLPARVIHDLDLSADLPAGWSAGVDVRNLLDRDTRDVARYPLPGRVVLFHLGWRGGGGGRSQP